MIITWDERKRIANIAKHGLDFAELDKAFFAVALIRPAKGRRFLAIGVVGGEMLAIVFRPLGSEALSIVSMRPASKKERADAQKNA